MRHVTKLDTNRGRVLWASQENKNRESLIRGGFEEFDVKRILRGLWELRDLEVVVGVRTPSGEMFVHKVGNEEGE